jgi:PAS domain-containing protein
MYQFIVTRRLLAIASQLRGVTAQDLRACPRRQAPAVQGASDELDDLAASIATLQATGRQALLAGDDEHALLRSLMNTIPDLVWLKDVNGLYLACNPRFEQFFGASERRCWARTTTPSCRETWPIPFATTTAAIEAGGSRSNEEWLVFKSAATAACSKPSRPRCALPDGKVAGVLGIAREVTKQRAAVRGLA